MILREMLSILEGKNHLGEPEQTTFAGWKRACKKVNPDVWFEGDKDIAQAMVGPKPYKDGETKSIGEWDGEKGSVYSHALKKVEEGKRQKQFDDVDDFMDFIDDAYDSAAGMWLGPNKKKQLMKIHNAGGKIASESGELDFKNAQSGYRAALAKAKAKWEKKGYEFFAGEENMSSFEVLFVKKALSENLDEAKGPKLKPQKFEPGWYVLDADNVPFHGPFKSDKEAGKELTKLSGRRGHGYHIDYIESIKESSDDEVTYKAWERAVKEQYPDLASKIKFKGNKDGDVEAIIPGVDRLYGIFDTEKNEGTVLGEGKLDEKRMEWHDSDAPDAEGKFKELGVKALGDWLIKTRNGDMKRINGSLTQQIVMNRKRDPAYAKKMESVREYVKGKLSKD